MPEPERQSAGSVTLLLLGVIAVDEARTKEFWELFFPRLVRLANKMLSSYQDAEDAAQEALVKFWTKATQDPESTHLHRFGIWAVLSKITVRQVLDFLKHRSRLKRGAGKVYSESDLTTIAGQDAWDLDCLIGELSFHTFDMIIEEILGSLSDETRSIVVRKMMGYSSQEIADQLGCSEKFVRVKLRKIREQLKDSNS